LQLLLLSGSLRARRWVGDWARDTLGRIVYIKILINCCWDGLDFGSQLLLDVVKIEAVVPVDQVDSQTKMSKSSRTTDTMEISFRVLRKVKVDHNVDGLDINTTSKQIRADKVAADSIAEVVENTVTVGLKHTGVTVKARVTQLCDLLREKFDTVCGVAKDDGLVNLELREERV